MNLNHYMKIQNAYGTKNKREKDLWKVNHNMSRHFNDTFDSEEVLLNGEPFELMIIKDSDGNVYKKKIKSKHEDKFKLGDYVEWNGQHWLITLLDHDEKTWNRGYMNFCGIALRWQTKDGEIIERWGYSEDFTKYSNGVISNNTMTLGDNQYGITLPIDDETKKLKRDMRFVIDFDDAEVPDTYKLTNRKVKLNDSYYVNQGGTMLVVLSFDEFNQKTDKKITLEDGTEVWVCDYNEPNNCPIISNIEVLDQTKTLKGVILGDDNLSTGFDCVYTACFTDEYGEQIHWNQIDFAWEFSNEFKIDAVIENDKVKLYTEDESLIGEKITLKVISHDNLLAQKEITISAGF